ncbi:orotate phosphoribosyltransferase 1 [Sutterella sp. CAG:351]|nr:orotate phosphoribosyltransferase 1 [Sutterella sp. CAG:351]
MRRFVKIGGKFFLSAEKTLRDSLGNSKMTTLEHDFIEFALKARVLRFGEFKTKAGRLSPYFFNAGLFNTGSLLDRLGAFYAKKILEKRESGELQFDMLFGPAYKGIPLVASIAINLSRLGLDLPWAFNRKEKKDHGEGGTIIGSPLTGRVLIVDDVISAGTSIRESIAIIRDNGAIPAGVAIALDRMEKGGNAEEVTETSAVQDVEKTFSIPVVSIANLTNLLEFLKSGSDAAQEFTSHTEAVTAYRNRYGA